MNRGVRGVTEGERGREKWVSEGVTRGGIAMTGRMAIRRC